MSEQSKPIPDIHRPNKGQYRGECSVKKCTNVAKYFNFSTKAYYCISCTREMFSVVDLNCQEIDPKDILSNVIGRMEEVLTLMEAFGPSAAQPRLERHIQDLKEKLNSL